MKLSKEIDIIEINFPEEIIKSIDGIISSHLKLGVFNNEFLDTTKKLLEIRDYYKKELKK